MSNRHVVELTVNGEPRSVLVDPRRTLLEVLREELELTGAKNACDVGDCGACTVLVDGRPVVSCLLLAVEANGAEVLTVEGLGSPGHLHPLQRAFSEQGATQCGFCTSGLILAAKGLLDENPDPSEAEIRAAIAGNICRCTGYVKIVAAIRQAAVECQKELATA